MKKSTKRGEPKGKRYYTTRYAKLHKVLKFSFRKKKSGFTPHEKSQITKAWRKHSVAVNIAGNQFVPTHSKAKMNLARKLLPSRYITSKGLFLNSKPKLIDGVLIKPRVSIGRKYITKVYNKTQRDIIIPLDASGLATNPRQTIERAIKNAPRVAGMSPVFIKMQIGVSDSNRNAEIWSNFGNDALNRQALDNFLNYAARVAQEETDSIKSGQKGRAFRALIIRYYKNNVAQAFRNRASEDDGEGMYDVGEDDTEF